MGIGSRILSRSEPIACARLLALINGLEYIRSDVCIKLLDGLLRIVIAEDGETFPRPDLILTAAKRMLKLGAFFGRDLPVLTSLCIHARALVTRGHRESASKIINICANDMKLTADEPDGGSIVTHLADTWCRACGQDGPLPDLPSKRELLLKIANLAPGRLSDQPAVLFEVMMKVIRRGDWEVQVTAHYGLLTSAGASKFEEDSRADLHQRLSQSQDGDQGVRATFALLLLLSDYIHKRDHEPTLNILRECITPDLPLTMPKGMKDTSLGLLQLLGEWDLALSICIRDTQRYYALLRGMRRSLTRPPEDPKEKLLFDIDAARIPPSPEASLSDLPLLYQSKALYLKGDLPGAYTIGKKHYEELLNTLRTVRLMSDLWEMQAQLMCTVDWMLTLLDALSNRRLVEYFVKAGRTYAASLRSSYWRTRMDCWLTHTTGRVHQGGLGGGWCRQRMSDHVDQVDQVGDDAHPPHITQIIKWLDSGTPEERVDLPSLHVRPLLRCTEPSSPVPPLLHWAYRCGRPDQVRLLACRYLEMASESAFVEILLQMILDREYLDEQPGRCASKLASLTMVMDVEVERIILYNRDCALFDCPVLVSIRVQSLAKLVEQLRGIVEENKQMLFHPKGEDGPPLLDDEFRRQWWQQRHSLERRMDSLVRELDESIMGPLLPFLFTEVPSVVEGDRGRDKELLRILSQTTISLPGPGSSPSTLARLLGILSRCSLEERSPGGSLLLTALGVGGECGRILSLFSQKRKTHPGRKFEEEDDPFAARTTSEVGKTSSSFSSPPPPPTPLLCLIQVDPFLHEFPWEACPSLATALMTLVRQSPHCGAEAATWPNLNLTITSLAAILNPSGDLRKTEESLRPLVEQLHPEPALIGRAPSREEMLQALRASLLLYAGHGAGDLYGSPREATDALGGGACATTAAAAAAAALLFGCSSGRLAPRGTYRMEGPLLGFLAARSPLILANLWDVTDRDIDRLTDIFVRELNLDERPTQISLARVMEALGRARNTCLLRLLNGFAPVILWNADCS